MSEIIEATPDQVQRLQDVHAKWIEWLKAEGEEKVRSAELNAPTDLFTAEASASLVFVVLKGHLTADLRFPSGQKMHFDGWPWGVGAYGGTGYGLYFGVNAPTLAGPCHYYAQGITSGGGILQATFWRDNFGALGQIDVAVAGIGAGETGGDDGRWTFA